MSTYPPLTEHARKRMDQRGIGKALVELTISYGREIHYRKAVYYFVGDKEIKKYKKFLDLKPCKGLHVVFNDSGLISTVYRNNKPSYRRK